MKKFVLNILLKTVLLAIVMLFIYKGIKPVLRREGYSYQYNNAVANTWILQSIAGIKEVKVAHKENFFVQEYSKYAKKAVETEKISSVLGNAPRLIIEAITISGMLGYIGVMVFNGREINTLLPQLSAFAVAAVRLLPSANRMSAALNSMAYAEPQLDKTIENLRVAESFENEDKKMFEEKKEERIISLDEECGLKGITFAYPNTEKNVLEKTDMRVPVGASVGIVGPSGAGKTTAVDILLGLLEPQEGMACSDGVNIQEGYSSWLGHLAYIPQMIYMLDDTIRANVAFGFSKEQIDDEQVWRALDEAQLGDFIRSLPEGLDTTIGERGVRLSGGQRQRISIARALSLEPEILVCDEATSALDVSVQESVIELLVRLQKEKNISMLFICHDLALIRSFAHQIAVMYLGNIVEVIPGEDVTEYAVHPYTQALLGAQFSIHMDPSQKIQSIESEAPSPLDVPKGCPFQNRCEHCTDRCKAEMPKLKEIAPGHEAACFYVEEHLKN